VTNPLQIYLGYDIDRCIKTIELVLLASDSWPDYYQFTRRTQKSLYLIVIATKKTLTAWTKICNKLYLTYMLLVNLLCMTHWSVYIVFSTTNPRDDGRALERREIQHDVQRMKMNWLIHLQYSTRPEKSDTSWDWDNQKRIHTPQLAPQYIFPAWITKTFTEIFVEICKQESEILKMEFEVWVDFRDFKDRKNFKGFYRFRDFNRIESWETLDLERGGPLDMYSNVHYLCIWYADRNI